MGPEHSLASGFNWGKVQEVGLGLMISPLIGFLGAALLLIAAKRLVRSPELYAPPPENGRPSRKTRGLLILTCTGELSRNRRVGLLLAQGHDLERVLAQLGHVSEGVASAKAVQKMAREAGVDMPITEAVCAVLFGGLSPEKALQLLLSRDPKSES